MFVARLRLRLRRTFTTSAHKLRLKSWRESLRNRTANRTQSPIQSLLQDFGLKNISFLTEDELGQFDTLLRLDDEELNILIERPGAPEERHPFLKDNYTLDRFLGFARFKSGTGEYR